MHVFLKDIHNEIAIFDLTFKFCAAKQIQFWFIFQRLIRSLRYKIKKYFMGFFLFVMFLFVGWFKAKKEGQDGGRMAGFDSQKVLFVRMLLLKAFTAKL